MLLKEFSWVRGTQHRNFPWRFSSFLARLKTQARQIVAGTYLACRHLFSCLKWQYHPLQSLLWYIWLPVSFLHPVNLTILLRGGWYDAIRWVRECSGWLKSYRSATYMMQRFVHNIVPLTARIFFTYSWSCTFRLLYYSVLFHRPLHILIPN